MNFEFTLNTNLETGIEIITEALKAIGFGMLSRINFDEKIKEKLGIELPRTTILGACNPLIAYEAYQRDSNVLLLIPCNVVLEETPGVLKIKIIKPSYMLNLLNSRELQTIAIEADLAIETAILTAKNTFQTLNLSDSKRFDPNKQ